MKIVVKIKNNFGDYESVPIHITDEEYPELLEMAKNFYKTGGYEMVTKEGFVVIPPDIVKQSILLIQIFKDDDDSTEE